MRRLCMLYNFAPKYREGIFRAIDDRWDTEWFFGTNSTDIKGLDLSVLRKTEVLENKRVLGHWYWQKGALTLLRKPFSTYFLLGDPYCLSSWVMALSLYFSRKKKLYFWSHGWYGKEGLLTKLIKKSFFRLAYGVFLYGNYARDLMMKEGMDGKQLFVIHNSLNYSRQLAIRNGLRASDIYTGHFGNDRPVLIFIGRLTKVKRLDMLLDATKWLKERGKQLNLVLVGDGDNAEALKAQTRELRLEDSCWFYGACYDEAVNAELIYNADLCVAPGNVGLTAMHAMVFGTPVISHSDFKWQMPEFEAIHPGTTGDFFERDNVDSLAASIDGWLSSHKDREKVRKACYDEIDSSWTPEFQMQVLEENLKV
ncbi:MAG: glycosyltransferase [Muribaculum sp.]|nr:glycosyltransferase [Muribaculum sp.]